MSVGDNKNTVSSLVISNCCFRYFSCQVIRLHNYVCYSCVLWI